MSTRGARRASLALAATLLTAGAAQAQKPMSAIDWLSKSVTRPATVPPAPPAGATLPGVPGSPIPGDAATGGALPGGALPGDTTLGGAVPGAAVPGTVAVSVLRQGPALDAVGLLPAAKTGLPRGFWGKTPTEDLVRLIRAEEINTLPALQRLFTTILLAELDPPDDSAGDGRLLLARVDRLLDLGALDQAQALLSLSGTDRPDIFRRWFDVALLLGDENKACATMRAAPDVAPTFPARIFCLARSGDWNAAQLTLQTAEALGFVNKEQSALLERFLDPELADGTPELPSPSRPSPLVWRMMEAIGQPMPTNTLPLAFAQGDLRENIGWKSQIEAAERLARTGAVSPARLMALYTQQKPAASGGVWDRAARIQELEAAIARKDTGAVARTLPAAWSAMEKAKLEVPFAAFVGPQLRNLPLTGGAAADAFRIGLLSPAYAAVAGAHKPANATEAFLAGLARGDLAGTTAPDAMGRAVAAAFADPAPVPADLAALLADQRLGEAVLRGMDRIAQGASGDLRSVTNGLALLRRAGLEDAARRTALELMLLDRRG